MKRKLAGYSLRGSGDLISSLPEDVINLILVRLPIRDAVRTSILSKKWRYKWVSILDVVFDKDSLVEGASETERTHAVDQVLFRHVGPIRKFLCMFYFPSCSHIDRWIMFLSRNRIKKIILMIGNKRDHGDVPSSIFNCEELSHLELFNCKFEVPPTFEGFHNLKVLSLNVSISEDAIECLISKSPLLERLKLRFLYFIRCLNIHAPNLRYLEVQGNFRDLSLGSSPLLTNVSIFKFDDYPAYLPPECGGNVEPVNTSSFIQFIGCLHGIERLALKGHFLQILCIGDIPEKLSAPCEHLKYLDIDTNLNPKELLATLCMLRSSPNLKELKIDYWLFGGADDNELSRKEAEFWGAEAQFDFSLSHLLTVEIIGLTTSFNLEFIRYILSNAPVLETMKIYTNEYVESEEVLRILTELFRFRRASIQAECIYLGHDVCE